MIIQVILGQVGKKTNSETGAVHTVHVKAVRRDLHDHVGNSSVNHLLKGLLEVEGLWSGNGCWLHMTWIANVYCSYNSHSMAAGL